MDWECLCDMLGLTECEMEDLLNEENMWDMWDMFDE